MQADISVIIPTWNRAHTIKTAIQSVLNQTYQPAEIIVSDDGSSDDTKAIVESISSDRVTFIDGGRGGNPAIPRNRAVRQAKSNLIAFLDSDDEWLPTKLEKQLNSLSKSNTKVIVTNAIQRSKVGVNDSMISFDSVLIRYLDLLSSNQIVCSSVLIDKELVLKAGLFPEDNDFKGFEDYALWLRCAMMTNIAFLNESLVIYNDDIDQSTARVKDQNEWAQKEIVARYVIDWVKTKPQLWIKAPIEIIKTYRMISIAHNMSLR